MQNVIIEIHIKSSQCRLYIVILEAQVVKDKERQVAITGIEG